MILVAKILIILFSFGGFGLAGYIRYTKKKAAPLVCPLEGSCDTVVHSDYSKIFGIPVELLGMAYYLLIALLYLAFSLFPFAVPAFLSYAVLGVTVSAFLFSLYLTAVQAFILKHWCTWCLISATICTAIFLLALYVADTKVLDLLSTLF
jgi:uncharacterized membrane protein